MAFAQIIATDCISPAGQNKNNLFKNCIEGAAATLNQGLLSFNNDDWQLLQNKTPHELKKSKSTVLSYGPLKSVLVDSKWTAEDLKKCGFIFASTTSKIDLWENEIPFFKSAEMTTQHSDIVQHQSLGTLLEDLRAYFNIEGPCSFVTSSCSASLQALSLAAMWIQNGKVDRCLVGSTEILSKLTSTGFESLRLLSKDICIPFDKNRNGINLGESSAFIALEKVNLSQTKPLAYLRGFGLSSDAYHATSPHPEGLGTQDSIKQALLRSGLSEKEISWFYAHGTGSVANDLAEAVAIEQIFTQNPFVSSSKAIHGHTLATSGLLESVLAVEALKNQTVIPNNSLKQTDPAFHINLITKPPTVKHILKNSLGFGGINCSIILSQEES
jgi:3-oxoacyl-(acyl-carrier-protein) synthase